MNTYIQPCGCKTQANFAFERGYLVKPCRYHAQVIDMKPSDPDTKLKATLSRPEGQEEQHHD